VTPCRSSAIGDSNGGEVVGLVELEVNTDSGIMRCEIGEMHRVRQDFLTLVFFGESSCLHVIYAVRGLLSHGLLMLENRSGYVDLRIKFVNENLEHFGNGAPFLSATGA
jgi:hypothetical protein